jgi:NAD(P)H dehydrogenase (quinone)
MSMLAITGASGQLGRLVTQELLDRGVAASGLVLVTRSPDALKELTAAGAQVRHGDFALPATLPAAFAGAERLLLISTDVVGARLDGHKAAIAAAKAAGVGRVVYTSAGNPVPENPAAAMADHRGTEDALRACGLSWTILRNALYAEYEAPGLRQQIASGQFVSNAGQGVTTYVSRVDCAAAAAGALLADDVDDTVFDVTGSELLSAADKAALAAELSGRPVEVVQVDDAAFISGLESGGIPSEIAQVIASFGTAIREGYLDQLSDAVEQLSGRPPRPLREVVAPALRAA